jgi:transcriptional regulator with XRE-family HTH domain
MSKISSGIINLDRLIDSLYIGDNVVWEVDAGTPYSIFIHNFVRRSFSDAQKVIYVSFNRSPQSIINSISSFIDANNFVLIDCFTSGKGKNDNTFLKFYEKPTDLKIIRIGNPKDTDEFTQTLNSIEDSFPPGARYIFDSLTGMQDLWGDENITYRLFTYMCPRLYDLDTVAYWILEKDAHSQKFKANLRHITQVVFDLYKRNDQLYIKALKLDGRQDREAFKPHLFEANDKFVTITLPRKEPAVEIGQKIKNVRTRIGISQKELADRVELSASFISQLENNQISPSLSSFLQICSALNVSPGELLKDTKPLTNSWLLKKDIVVSVPPYIQEGIKIYDILSDEKLYAKFIEMPPDNVLQGHFFHKKSPEFICVLDGHILVTVEGIEVRLSRGDSIFLKENIPTQWKNEESDRAELLMISSN